jgi:putative membrane-bound dehydrogenase-like protein
MGENLLKIMKRLLGCPAAPLLVALAVVNMGSVQAQEAWSPPEGFVALFDGERFDGWEGNLAFFRIEDGIIKAGRLDAEIPRNEFLCTEKGFSDFELRLEVKTSHESVNAGIQFRSKRAANHHEVQGYQADVAKESERNIWGSLYDEARRRVMLVEGDQAVVAEAYRANDWNDYTIRAQGNHIQLWINGQLTADYREDDRTIARTGIIGLQIHSGPPAEAWYRHIAIKDLDPERAAEKAPENMELYPGLEATVFASDPFLASPSNIDVDDRGRVWVCEIVNYRQHFRDNLRPEGDRILIFEDQDGDGVAETRKVFYQGKDVDSALGICVLGNKVIVSSAPNVIVFTDEDGDDVPDKKEIMFRRVGEPQHDHSTHSFIFGPDGKLYWNVGNTGRHVHDKDDKLVIDKLGNPVLDRQVEAEYRRANDAEDIPEAVYQGGMVFRCNPDGSEFEVLGHNFRNNYEMTIDSYGTIWQSDNDDDGNLGARQNFVMEFGNYGYFDEMTGAGWRAYRTGQDETKARRHWHQNDPGVVPNLVVYGNGSPCAGTVYEGRLLPEGLWDRALFCEAGWGVMWSPQAEKDGAGYTAELIDVLKGTGDKWIRPVDVATSPDGGLYVSDWYDPGVGGHHQADTERGRIYRVAPPGHVTTVPEYDYSTAEGAVEALKNPASSVRYLAWTALHAMGRDAESALLDLYSDGNPRFRARALWLLSKIDGRGKGHIRTALTDDNEDIRIVGLRAARQIDMNVLPLVDGLIEDGSPAILRECAIALRDNESRNAASLWAKLATRYDGEDAWYLEALGISAEGQWDGHLAAWLKAIDNDWDNDPGRDILWRSRGEDTIAYLAEMLRKPDVDIDGSTRYMRALDFYPEGARKTQVLRDLAFDSTAGNSDTGTFIAAEALMRLSNLEVYENPEVGAAVNEVITRAEGTEQFARLVQRFQLEEHYPGLLRQAVANKETEEGIASVRLLIDLDGQSIISNFIATSDSIASTAILEVLGHSRDEDAVPLLQEVMQNDELPWEVRDQAVRALARTGEGGRWLVAFSEAGQFPESLKQVAGAAMSSVYNNNLRKRAAVQFPMPPLKGDKPLPPMRELLAMTGNTENGPAVFKLATCVECHIINGEGINYGPDLSQIGNKLSKRALFESILDPGAGISDTYRSYQFELSDGHVVTGLLESETASTVTVRMAGGVVEEYDSGDVVARRAEPLSAMPVELQKAISLDELVDLVEYLLELK